MANPGSRKRISGKPSCVYYCTGWWHLAIDFFEQLGTSFTKLSSAIKECVVFFCFLLTYQSCVYCMCRQLCWTVGVATSLVVLWLDESQGPCRIWSKVWRGSSTTSTSCPALDLQTGQQGYLLLHLTYLLLLLLTSYVIIVYLPGGSRVELIGYFAQFGHSVLFCVFHY